MMPDGSRTMFFGFGFVVLIVVGIALLTLMLYPSRKEMGGGGRAGWWWLGLLLATTVAMMDYTNLIWSGPGMDHEQTIKLGLFIPARAGLFIFFAPLLAKLHATWMNGHLTDQERAGGREAVRAWLRGRHLFLVVMIALCARYGYGFNGWAVGSLCMLVLLASPVVHTWWKADVMSEESQDQGDERNRVLRMLEEGRITASEGADLLNALGEPAPKLAAPARGACQKLLLCGAAVVLVGFLLPWFDVNVRASLNGQMGQMMGNWPGSSNPGQPFGMNSANGPAFQLKATVVGSQVGHGLGWVVLLGSIAAAAVPMLAADQTLQRQKQFIAAALLVAGITLLAVASQSIRAVSIGIVVALVGLLLQAGTFLRDRRMSSHMAEPAAS